jgi:DNA-binding MarR family transcriptional regulator
MSKATEIDAVEAWREQERAYHATATLLDRALKQEFDLGLSEFEVLDRVGDANGEQVTMRTLVDLTPLTQSALSRVVDRLTRAGMIGRDECSFDRRSMFVSLTDEGTRVHAQARQVYRRLLAGAIA